MKLRELKDKFFFKEVHGNLDLSVSGCTSDSRNVCQGDLFLCFTGEKHDGHDFALEALSKGAVGIVAQREISGLPEGTPFFLTENVRLLAGPISSLIYGEPSKKLNVLGITGTSGKTTTAYFIESCLKAAGKDAELVGSLDPTPEFPFHTTPEAPALQKRLKEIQKSGKEFAVLEVSSHAIHFGRINGVEFRGAVLTNIYRDHLDLHGTEEEYAYTKLKWLKSVSEKGTVVLNMDFPRSEECLKFLNFRAKTVSLVSDADIRGSICSSWNLGNEVEVKYPGGTVRYFLSLPGEVNVSNSLSAFGMLFSLGIDPAILAEGLSQLREVKGRYKMLTTPWESAVIIDYAHTPVALEKALSFARAIGKRVTLVFGCVGSGDRGKRPIMGKIAARLADVIFVTTDDPREEDPVSTMEGIKLGLKQSGLKEGKEFFLIPDRSQAIALAVKSSQKGDAVLIAGRGHEKYQRFKDRLVYLDDEEEVRKAMGEK